MFCKQCDKYLDKLQKEHKEKYERENELIKIILELIQILKEKND